jgi:Lrp/AsnC family leucine-responsive transcriptional regulator
MMNDIDNKILNIIQQDARIANAEIARRIGLAPSAVLERLRKLEESGVIRRYTAEIDAAQIGFGITAFIFVRTNECGDGTDQLLAQIPEVLEVHDVAGEDSYLLKVRAKNTEGLARLLREKIKAVPNVISTRTTVVLQTVKETIALPLDRVIEDAPARPKGRGGIKNKVSF